MENKTWIIILSVFLTLSLLLNIAFFYTVPYISMEWENAYDKNDMEWCMIANKDNQMINGLLDDLAYYNQEYELIPRMMDLDCFS